MWFLSQKQTIADSGVLDGFTDRHTHLLPGVDDGFSRATDSLQAIATLKSLGVRQIWLTPHIMEDVPNTPEQLQSRFDEFRQQTEGAVHVELAAENMLDNLFVERFESGSLLTMEGRMLLVETSYMNPPYNNLPGTLGNILFREYVPLLAHPERYRYLQQRHYEELREQGVKFQLNLGSLTGLYGKEAGAKAKWMLQEGMYDCAGSDIHSLRHLDKIINTPVAKSTLRLLRQLTEKDRG